MTTNWPLWMTNSFLSAHLTYDVASDESTYYGSYTSLLLHLFGGDGPFEIAYQFNNPSSLRDATDVVATFAVELNKHPVLFIQLRPPSSFRLDSVREQADDQMREHFRDLHARPASMPSACSSLVPPFMNTLLLRMLSPRLPAQYFSTTCLQPTDGRRRECVRWLTIFLFFFVIQFYVLRSTLCYTFRRM